MFHKYRAKRTSVNGIKFDSKAEALYYQELLLQEKLGLIKILELQPKIYLTDAKILYKPDFLIEENGPKFYLDVKGMETPVFRLKKRLWRFYGPKEPLRLIGLKGKTFRVLEEIDAV